MASLDGRIDCAMTEQIDDTNHYYEALAQLGCPSTLEGKTTLAMHYAQEGTFQPARAHEDAGLQLYKAVEAKGYAVGIDTNGTLRWDDNTTELFGRPLLMILSEHTSQEYLDYLKQKHISFITSGRNGIDFASHGGPRAHQLPGGQVAVLLRHRLRLGIRNATHRLRRGAACRGGRWSYQRIAPRPWTDRRDKHDVRLRHRRTRGNGCCFRRSHTVQQTYPPHIQECGRTGRHRMDEIPCGSKEIKNDKGVFYK